jgi:hypothetical protein
LQDDKKNTVQSQVRIFILNISKQKFKQNLTERINIGEELYSRQIQDEDGLNKLESDVKLWNDYNSEMLKQIFVNA